MPTAEQQSFDGATHDANSTASQIVKPLIKEQPHQLSESVRFILLASRTQGIVKRDAWLTSLADTNQKLRKPASADSQKGLF